MNYQKVYNQIIERAKNRKLDGYKEKHHVIPKCVGGSNQKNNIVELTAREHFLCHWLLCRQHPENNKLAFAFWGMCNQKNPRQKQRYTPSSKTYEEAKQLNSYFSSVVQKNKKVNIESIKKMVQTRRDNGSYNQTLEHRIKNSLSNRGKKRSAEYCDSMSKRLKGVPKSESHIEKMKKPRKKTECKYCKKLVSGGNMKRWHDENCKHKYNTTQ